MSPRQFLAGLIAFVAASSLAHAATRQTTDFGVRTPPGSAAETAWPDRPSTDQAVNGRFTCRVASVTDGDTFRCADGVRVRLSSIDAPETPGSCRPGRQCVAGDPYAAKDALARLIAGRTVTCEPVGTTYGRVAAWCSVGGEDLSCAMVRSGHAVRRYERARRVCG